MSRVILLDTGPLGLVTHPRMSREITEWLKSHLGRGVTVLIPEVADYELRRELLRANKVKSVAHLDELKLRIGYVPITTSAMLRAAEFWAQARKMGRPTADDAALDGDMILAAQAATYHSHADSPIIATTNVGHLSQFADARQWRDIR